MGPNFIIIFRLSMLDLVEGGSTWEEVVQLAKAIEAASATIINTGIGWHEAHPDHRHHGAARRVYLGDEAPQGEVKIPLITTNRINTPEVAEAGAGQRRADMVSMARPSSPTLLREQGRRRQGRRKPTPVSPATRPAWTTSSTEDDSCLGTRVPATKPSSDRQTDAREEGRCGRGRPGRHGVAPPPPPERGHA